MTLRLDFSKLQILKVEEGMVENQYMEQCLTVCIYYIKSNLYITAIS